MGGAQTVGGVNSFSFQSTDRKRRFVNCLSQVLCRPIGYSKEGHSLLLIEVRDVTLLRLLHDDLQGENRGEKF